MKTRHVGPIPEGKRHCSNCEGWGVSHYSAEEIGKPVTCSKCEGEGLEESPTYVPPFCKTVGDEFEEWLAEQEISPSSPEAIWAEKAWNAAADRYIDDYGY